MNKAIAYVLQQQNWMAGKYHIAFQASKARIISTKTEMNSMYRWMFCRTSGKEFSPQ